MWKKIIDTTLKGYSGYCQPHPLVSFQYFMQKVEGQGWESSGIYTVYFNGGELKDFPCTPEVDFPSREF